MTPLSVLLGLIFLGCIVAGFIAAARVEGWEEVWHQSRAEEWRVPDFWVERPDGAERLGDRHLEVWHDDDSPST